MSNREKLKKIADGISSCQNCPLYKNAHMAVPGGPNPDAEVVFIGEAPGYWEDQKGIPFCGAAGNLLNKLLQDIQLKREDVFIGNVIKHRPPNNRDPLPQEIEACTPWLKKQLLVIKPKVVITLGRFAMNYFIPNAYISRVHGKVYQRIWQGLNLTILPIYHPAAALRSGQMMQALQTDFKLIPQIIERVNEEITKQVEENKPKPEQKTLF